MKDSTGNAQIASRRDHVNTIGLGTTLALYFRDTHFAFLGKQLREVALVLRIEVLNQHECHAGIVRQMAEQLRECLQSAGGRPDANNGGDTAFGDGNGPHRRGGLPSRGRSLLWAGRVRRTRRPRYLVWPATAGLLCHTPPLPFPLDRSIVIARTRPRPRPTKHAERHSRTGIRASARWIPIASAHRCAGIRRRARFRWHTPPRPPPAGTDAGTSPSRHRCSRGARARARGPPDTGASGRGPGTAPRSAPRKPVSGTARNTGPRRVSGA